VVEGKKNIQNIDRYTIDRRLIVELILDKYIVRVEGGFNFIVIGSTDKYL
jgi:hypothetical protein